MALPSCYAAVMNSEYKHACPCCGTPIRPEDVIVGGNAVLCRKCGKVSAVHSFDTAADTAAKQTGIEASSPAANNPPRGIKIKRNPSGGIIITYKRIKTLVYFQMLLYVALCILLICSVPWSLTSLADMLSEESFCFTKMEDDNNIYIALSKSILDNDADLTFLVPAVVLLLIVAPYTIFVLLRLGRTISAGLFERHKITLSCGKVSVSHSSLFGSMRTFTHSRDSRVAVLTLDEESNTSARNAIIVFDKETAFVMCGKLPSEPKLFIADLLQREIARGSEPASESQLTLDFYS